MILFLCTGNTCRSPMAAAMARAKGIDAASAGLFAVDGAPASPQAVRAAARRGGDLRAHAARTVTESMIRQADQIYVMTEAHRQALTARFPGSERKTRVLSPSIPDPYGGDDRVYEQCAQALETAMARAGIIP